MLNTTTMLCILVRLHSEVKSVSSFNTHLYHSRPYTLHITNQFMLMCTEDTHNSYASTNNDNSQNSNTTQSKLQTSPYHTSNNPS